MPKGTNPIDGSTPTGITNRGAKHVVVRIRELLAADLAVSFQDFVDIYRKVVYHNTFAMSLIGKEMY